MAGSRAATRIAFVLTFLFAFVVILPGPPATLAGDDAYQLTVSAVLCDVDTCEHFDEWLVGMTISAVDVFGGAVLDSCVVGEGSGEPSCTLDLVGDPTMELTWDESQVPAGYVPFGYPFEMDDGAGGSITYLGFVPDAPPPTPSPASIGVTVALCDDDTCTTFSESVIGVEVSAIDTGTSEIIDTCVTVEGNQIQGCGLDIPEGVDWMLEWDDSLIPASYQPWPEILHPTDGPGPHPYIIAYYPVPAGDPDPAPETPIVALPETGSGPYGSGRTGPVMALFTLSAIVVAASAAEFIHRHRR